MEIPLLVEARHSKAATKRLASNRRWLITTDVRDSACEVVRGDVAPLEHPTPMPPVVAGGGDRVDAASALMPGGGGSAVRSTPIRRNDDIARDRARANPARVAAWDRSDLETVTCVRMQA